MHMLSKKDSKLSRIGDSASFPKPRNGCHSQWRSAKQMRDATMYVKEFDLFRDSTDTRSYAGSALARKNSSKNTDMATSGTSNLLPHLVEHGRRTRCNTENHVPIFVPRIANWLFPFDYMYVYNIVTAGTQKRQHFVQQNTRSQNTSG